MNNYRAGGMNDEYGHGGMHDEYGHGGMHEYKKSGKMPKALLEYFMRKKKAAMGMKMPMFQGSGAAPNPVMDLYRTRMAALGASNLGQHQGQSFVDAVLSSSVRDEDRAALEAELKASGLPRRVFAEGRSYGDMVDDFRDAYGGIGQGILEADIARYNEALATGDPNKLPRTGLNYAGGNPIVHRQGDPESAAYAVLTKDLYGSEAFDKLSKTQQDSLYEALQRASTRFGEGNVDFSKFMD